MKLSILSLLAGACLCAASALADFTVGPGSGSGILEAEWNGDNASFTQTTASTLNFVGAMNGSSPGLGRAPVVAYNLSVLGIGQTVGSAVLSMSSSSELVSSFPWFNVDVYGFTTTPVSGDWYVGTNDLSKIMVADDFITTESTPTSTLTLDVTDFLANLYVNGTPSVSTVYFRFNGDDADGSYDPATGEGDGFGRYRPFLASSTLDVVATAVPEPETYALYFSLVAFGAVVFQSRRR